VLVLSGFFEGLELPIDRDWLVIGRGRQAGLVLAEPTISRAHAALGYDGTAFFVQDLQSTNGTMVNGERRDRAPLRDHDEIQIGRLQLQVRISPRREAA
jgi:pSer/pThr/pTyr-binding forkhead associated (FHA) protein